MDKKGRATAVSLENEPVVVDIGGVWKKAFKQGRYKGKSYPKIVHCHKCGARILNKTWFYVRLRGGKYPRRTFYCESCYEGLWYE